MYVHALLFILLWSLPIKPIFADTAYIQPGESWGGSLKHVRVKRNQPILSLAETESVGFDALAAANPGASLSHVKPGTQLLLPTMYLLPSVQKGIVINLPEKRLYYFQAKDVVHIFPVAIGKVQRNNARGVFSITDKRFKPIWTVPASVLKEEREKGNIIPPVFPAGPANPLGNHAMRLSHGSILIHGTNNISGVGRRSTSGCYSMYPNDVATLFEMVPVGTPVTVIDEPIKIARTPKGIYIESHPTLNQTSNHSFRSPTSSEIKANVAYIQDRYPNINTIALYSLFSQNMGVPIPIEKPYGNKVSKTRSTPRG